MLGEMPCGKEQVVHNQTPENAAFLFTERLKVRTLIGFAEVDIEIPKAMWLTF